MGAQQQHPAGMGGAPRAQSTPSPSRSRRSGGHPAKNRSLSHRNRRQRLSRDGLSMLGGWAPTNRVRKVGGRTCPSRVQSATSPNGETKHCAPATCGSTAIEKTDACLLHVPDALEVSHGARGGCRAWGQENRHLPVPLPGYFPIRCLPPYSTFHHR